MGELIRKNWEVILAMILIIVACLMYGNNVPPLLDGKTLFWAIIAIAVLNVFKINRPIRGIFGVALPAVAVISLYAEELNLSVAAQVIIPGVVGLLWFIFDWHRTYSLIIFIMTLGFWVFAIRNIGQGLWQAELAKQPGETVVLQKVDVKSDKEIYISTDDGIYKISPRAAKTWHYHKGDTVTLVLRDGEVIFCREEK